MIKHIDKIHNTLTNRFNWYNRYHQWEHHHKVHWAVLAMYVLSLFSFGFASVLDVPRASATDPEIIATLTSGTMPETASVTKPPGGADSKEAIYDFGSTYNVTSYAVTNSCSPPPGVNAEIASWTLYLTTDTNNWGTAVATSPGCGTGSGTVSKIARYAKWKVAVDTSLAISPVPDGTHFITLSSPHLYGTGDSPPTISISSPSNNCSQSKHFTKNSSVSMSGTASDDVSVSSVTTSPSSSVSGTTSWSTSSITIPSEGDNTFSATATDSSAQTGSASITVNKDTQAPSVTISSPSNGYSTSNSSVVVSGSSSDNSGGSSVSSVSSSTGSSVSGTTSWSTTVNLSNGSNTITITATDCAGNTGSSSITVTKTTSGTGDTCDLSAPTVQDCGDAVFGTITIKSPNGGENYLVGSGTNATPSTTITWDYDQGTYKGDHILLQYTTNNSTYQDINTNININSTSYSWTLPTNLKSQQVKVKAKVLDKNSVQTTAQDTSDNNFELHWNEAPGAGV